MSWAFKDQVTTLAFFSAFEQCVSCFKNFVTIGHFSVFHHYWICSLGQNNLMILVLLSFSGKISQQFHFNFHLSLFFSVSFNTFIFIVIYSKCYFLFLCNAARLPTFWVVFFAFCVQCNYLFQLFSIISSAIFLLAKKFLWHAPVRKNVGIQCVVILIYL